MKTIYTTEHEGRLIIINYDQQRQLYWFVVDGRLATHQDPKEKIVIEAEPEANARSLGRALVFFGITGFWIAILFKIFSI